MPLMRPAIATDPLTSQPAIQSAHPIKIGRHQYEGNFVAELDLAKLTISDASQALRSGVISSRELTDAYLARIEALNPRINAYVNVTADRARADADKADADRAKGIDLGPLHGVPVAHKDLYETAGIRTTGGGKIHANNVPERDSTVVSKLKAAGTVLLGKLNTHEYAYGGTTNNPHFGATHNPWNLDHIPGGSSGGSGAAVAAGLTIAATGTDTGGSIRLPASFCGVVGLKPNFGRVSKAGVMPLSYGYDHAGPLANTVHDAALMLNAMAGYDAADPASIPMEAEDFTRKLNLGVRGLRIGVLRNWFFDGLQDGIGDAVENAIAEFTRLGAHVEDVTITGAGEALAGLFGYVLAEAQDIHADALRSRPQDFGDDVRALLQSPAPDVASMMSGLRANAAWTAACRVALQEFDVFLTPTVAITAPLIGEEIVRVGGAEESVMGAMIRNTGPFNGNHLPALTVPCGFNAEGLPIGLQIVGRPFEEATVVQVGHAYEQATEWRLRKPTL